MVIPMEPRNDRNQPFSPRGTRRGRRRATRWMVTCALLCALAVVTLGMGALVELFDLTAAAVAAVVLLPILLCYGVRYAVLSYAVTAVLGVILMPHSLGSWMFLALTGYYPLIKKRLDRLPRILAWAAKLSVVGVVLFAYLGLFYLLVMGGNGSFVDTLILGIGTVISINPLAGTIRVVLKDSPDTPPKQYHRSEVTPLGKAPKNTENAEEIED